MTKALANDHDHEAGITKKVEFDTTLLIRKCTNKVRVSDCTDIQIGSMQHMKPIYPESEFYLKRQISFQDHYIKVQIHRTSKINTFQMF
jgi:hypothetical protein